MIDNVYSKTLINQINTLGLNIETFSLIVGISENIMKSEKKLSSLNVKSQKIINKLEELYNILLEFFNEDKKIRKWLNKSNKSLSSISPIQHIIRSKSKIDGIEQIIDLLKGSKLGISG